MAPTVTNKGKESSEMKNWVATQIEARKTSELTKYEKNSRIHSPEQVDQIAASIEKFGFTIPVLIDDTGTIIAGHGRVMALEKLGIDDVPVIVAKGWTKAMRAAYVIADNKHTMNGKWDYDKLGAEFNFLEVEGFDLNLTGFDSAEINHVLGEWDTDHEFIDKITAADEPLAARLIITGSEDELEMFHTWLTDELQALGYGTIEVQRK
jgi:ParB-like chromosome segregation protein Spo0J